MNRSLATLRAQIVAAYHDALHSLHPAQLVKAALPDDPPTNGRVVTVAVGKAAPTMLAGALERWPAGVTRGLVSTIQPPRGPVPSLPPGFVWYVAGHPVPDERSVAAGDAAVRLASELGPGDLLLALISGGASSLLVSLPTALRLPDKQSLVATLLERGAPIADVNLVRRHLSRIKGGRLAEAASRGGRARVLSLILSDVIGGAAHDIGSGPTAFDPTTADEARAVLKRYAIDPPNGITESPKLEALAVESRILADTSTLSRAVAAELRHLGLSVAVDPLDQGLVEEVVDRRVARAQQLSPGSAVVVGCEPTIVLPKARGRGGRAGYVALAACRRLPEDVVLLCAASDGVDGNSGAGGAAVTSADAVAVDPTWIDEKLRQFDDASAHARMNTALRGAPTGNNLADVHVLARLPASSR